MSRRGTAPVVGAVPFYRMDRMDSLDRMEQDEQRNRGTEEQRNRGTEEQRWRGGQRSMCCHSERSEETQTVTAIRTVLSASVRGPSVA
jgi:hypothetical protein